MDILSHIAIGTVIGEIVLGRKAGKKALLWGAIGGIIPDLDMFIYPFLEQSQALLFHRSYSHSILFIFLISPFIGWLIASIYKNKRDIKPKTWAFLIIIECFVHICLDLFTGYGTGILVPFDDGRYGLGSIAPIDLFFSLPLFVAMFWVLISKTENKRRLIITWLALSLSILYLPYTVINKAHANSIFENALHIQKKKFFQVKAYPQIPCNFIWLCVAKTRDGYWVGYYNQLKKDSVQFRFVPKNDYWLLDYENNPKIKRLKRFSKNEYSVQHTDKGDLLFSVLRFGWLGTSADANPMVSYYIRAKGNDIVLIKNKPSFTLKN
jgi:inner membrane protein